jgi:hypothetical protein
MDEIAEKGYAAITNIKWKPRGGLDNWLNLLKEALKIQKPVQ